MLKGQITKEGLLQIERAGVMRRLYCPYHPAGLECGDWCPHFKEPVELAARRASLHICGETLLLFDKLEDCRQGENMDFSEGSYTGGSCLTMGAQRDINDLVLVGRLTRDMELKFTRSGAAVGELSIAVNSVRKRGDGWEEETSFFPVVVYGKTAENLEQYLTKGVQIAVRGELQQQRWEYEGKKYSKIVIHAAHIQLLNRPAGASSPQRSDTYQKTTHRTNSRAPRSHAEFTNYQSNQAQDQQSYAGPEFFDDDIPF